MHSAHLIRRARFFCLLSESALAWTAADQPQEYKIMLVFEKGRVIQRNELIAGGELMIPPGFVRSFRDRQRNIDLVS
jgi:DNA polymerase III subunit epsilon